eukprot:Selendium_serpulae@DN2991_c0_g1_i1.p1
MMGHHHPGIAGAFVLGLLLAAASSVEAHEGADRYGGGAVNYEQSEHRESVVSPNSVDSQSPEFADSDSPVATDSESDPMSGDEECRDPHHHQHHQHQHHRVPQTQQTGKQVPLQTDGSLDGQHTGEGGDTTAAADSDEAEGQLKQLMTKVFCQIPKSLIHRFTPDTLPSWAVLLLSVSASFMGGWLWRSPLMMQDAWHAVVDVDPSALRFGVRNGVPAFVAEVIKGVVLSHVIGYSYAVYGTAVAAGTVVCLAWLSLSIDGAHRFAFSRQKMALFSINVFGELWQMMIFTAAYIALANKYSLL